MATSYHKQFEHVINKTSAVNRKSFKITKTPRQQEAAELKMDDESILHHLQLPNNSTSKTNCNRGLVILIISLSTCVVLMVSGIIFAFIVLEKRQTLKIKLI